MICPHCHQEFEAGEETTCPICGKEIAQEYFDFDMLKEMLINRFKKHTNELESEAKFIKEFQRVLDNYCSGKEISIKVVMLQEFSKDLEEIIDLYDSSVFENKDDDIDILAKLEEI